MSDEIENLKKQVQSLDSKRLLSGEKNKNLKAVNDGLSAMIKNPMEVARLIVSDIKKTVELAKAKEAIDEVTTKLKAISKNRSDEDKMEAITSSIEILESLDQGASNE